MSISLPSRQRAVLCLILFGIIILLARYFRWEDFNPYSAKVHPFLTDAYPAVDYDFLTSNLNYLRHYEELKHEGYFEIEGIKDFCANGVGCQQLKQVISVSLFYAGHSDLANDPNGSNFLDDANFMAKQLSPFLRDMAEMRTKQWIYYVYACPAVFDYVNRIFATNLTSHGSSIRLFRMKRTLKSLGSLWRFIPLSDQSLDAVIVTDFATLLRLPTWWSTFLIDTGAGLACQEEAATKLSSTPPAYNLPVISLSQFAARPKLLANVSMVELLERYTAYRLYRIGLEESYSGAGRKDRDYESDNVCNQPLNIGFVDHKFGWGNIPFADGFDARFLKVAYFATLIRRRRVSVYAFNRTLTLDADQSRLQYNYLSYLSDYNGYKMASYEETRLFD